MKAMARKIATMVFVVAFACVGLVGCGAISIDDIKGDWTVDTMNGKSLADYAAELGASEDMFYTNWTINEDNTLTSTNAVGQGTLKLELKSNGFEAKEEASGSVFSVEFNKDAGTLSYKLDPGNGEVTIVMKRGTYTPSAAEEATEEATEEGTEEGVEEGTEESGEEYSEEDLGEDEGYSEEAEGEEYSEEEQ